MEFNTTVYCQTTVIVLLIISYLFGECAAGPPGPTIFTEIKPNLELLAKLASAAEKITTWKSLVKGSKQESIQLTPYKGEYELIKDIIKTLNNILYDLQCTYALFAINHVKFIHSIIDNDLLTEETFEAVRSIKKVYLKTAIKTKDTFFDFRFQFPDWLRLFINFLSKVDFTPTFHEELSHMIDVLKKVTSTSSCNGDEISAKMIGFSRSAPLLILEGDYSHMHVDWVVLDRELHYFLNFHLWCSLNTDKLSPEYLDGSKSKQWKQILMSSGRISKQYMYKYLLETSAHVKQNLVMGAHFVLHKNRGMLSFKETPFDPFMMYRKRKTEHAIDVESEHKRQLTGHEAYLQFYAAELIEIDQRLRRGLSLLNIRVWGYHANKKIIATLTQIPESYNMVYYRDRYALINKFTDDIIDTMNCLYAFHTHVHVTEMLVLYNQMIVSADVRKKYFFANADLAFKYFDIMLKTMATIYNENFATAGWMLIMVIYFEKVKYLYNHDIEFLTITGEVLKYLKYSCDQCYQQSKIKNLPLQEIQEIYDHNNFKTYMSLQLEFAAIKFEYDDDRKKTVSTTYENLMQVEFFLDVNSTVLNHNAHKDFHPSNWFLDSIKLTDNPLGNFKWDTLSDNNILNNVAKEFIGFIQLRSNIKEIIPMQRILISNSLYFKVLDFINAAVIRLVGSFLIQCKGIMTSTFFGSNNENATLLFAEHCTGMSEPVKLLIDALRLNKRNNFLTTLWIELRNFEFMVNQKKTDLIETEGIKRLIEKCILKLHEISINGLTGVNIPFEMISVTEKNLKSEETENVWSRLQCLKTRAQDLIQMYDNNFKASFGNLRMRNVFLNSLTVLWPHALYDDKLTIPDPERDISIIDNYIHYKRAQGIKDPPNVREDTSNRSTSNHPTTEIQLLHDDDE